MRDSKGYEATRFV